MTGIQAEERFSFAPFARHELFTHVNRWIVERAICPGRQVIVDLACGPGAVTQLILERVGADSGARIIGIDQSPPALARARAAISSRLVEFVQGNAERLSCAVSGVDAVVFLNAIHLVPDKAQVLAEIRKVLRPGGLLAFNSTFFTGAYVEGTSKFWRRWVLRAVQVLKERGIEPHRTAKPTAMQWLGPKEYAALCTAAGFRPTTLELVQVEMTPESLEDIGRFSLFIEGALPGVPLDDGAAALQEGLRRTLQELGASSVPRNWLECVAEAT